MQRLGDLQIGNVLHLVGDRGRAVIGEMFRRLDDTSAASRPLEGAASHQRPGRVTQTVRYSGRPRTVARLDVTRLSVWRDLPGGHRDGVRRRRHTGRGRGSSSRSRRRNAAAGEMRSCAPFASSASAPSNRTRNIRSAYSSILRSRRCRRRSTTRRRRSRPSTSSRTCCVASAQANWTPAAPPTTMARFD